MVLAILPGGNVEVRVGKVTGGSLAITELTELQGPAYGYHGYDVNLALGNLAADVAAAESTWSRR